MLYAPTNPREPRPDRDKATGDGMPLTQLEDMLSDIQQQPQWRDAADKAFAYYDSKQLTSAQLATMEETGEPKTIVNLIQRTVNGALGNEAKSRLDWKASADANAYRDVADAIHDRLKEAQREAMSDVAVSEAYKSMLVAGIGWVEVSRNPNPLLYPYRVKQVHRNEVWWDWRGRDMMPDDWRWVCRQTWVDVDDAVSMLPQFRDVFELGCTRGPITDMLLQRVMHSASFESLQETRRSFSRMEEEWLDNSVRKRVRFYDVHYKHPQQVLALVTGTTRRKFNPQNPLHMMVLQRGMGQLVKGPGYVIRRAMFAGPYRLFDEATKLRHFPLIPFWCYRDDEFGTPYGLVHGMIDPQDEYNERRSRLRWLLKAKQVFVDNDALDQKFNTFKQLALEVMRPDAMFVLNATRKNANGLRVEQNTALAREQVDVMQDAKQLIQDVPGLYSALLGKSDTGVSSGVALNSLVEQSITSLGETSDNYRYGRTRVGEVLQDLIAEDLAAPNLQLEVGTARKRRVVVLNTFDQQGIPVNMVDDAAVKIGLSDLPSTSAAKAQQTNLIGNALSSAGNDQVARAVLLPAFIESMDIENAEFYARVLRQQYGVPEPGGSEEDPQGEAQAQAQKQQMAAVGQELQLRGAVADVAKKEADAMQAQARAEREHIGNAQALAAPMLPAPSEEDQINAALDEAANQPMAQAA